MMYCTLKVDGLQFNFNHLEIKRKNPHQGDDFLKANEHLKFDVLNLFKGISQPVSLQCLIIRILKHKIIFLETSEMKTINVRL